jgi:hypothetical protein
VPFPRKQRGRDVKLTTHLHLVPRLRMRGAIPPLPQHISSRGKHNKEMISADFFFFFFFFFFSLLLLNNNN